MKSSVLRARNSTVSQSLCADALSYWIVQKSLVKATRLLCTFLGAAKVKLKQFVIGEPNKIHRRSRVASQQLTRLVETSKLVVTTHFMTSALRHDHQITFTVTNSHILLKYFDVVFIQLQLPKNSYKFIAIRLSYERKKRGAIFYETPCSRRTSVQYRHIVRPSANSCTTPILTLTF